MTCPAPMALLAIIRSYFTAFVYTAPPGNVE